MTPEDRDLTAAKAGDHAAFARIYDRHAAVVVSYCRSRGDGDGTDAAQEAFLRAFNLLEQVASPRALRSWLIGISRRVCAERRRAARRRNHHEEQAMTIRLADREQPRVSDAAIRAERMQSLSRALEKLPDDERLAIHLFYLEDDAANAAADSLGLSRSGFYKLLARARQRLANAMREVPQS
ncbi:MAG TPA: sigma-70 family RNA polymerase sigma factor [Phycisphaerae bacterium]|nr:sigma-70 family RNA polymerase sigma factor [Phycisphaerae bacterium]HRW53972.1 sigma-70 family RNA polymerase sigma factor [Phycisphaerae bacterium]